MLEKENLMKYVKFEPKARPEKKEDKNSKANQPEMDEQLRDEKGCLIIVELGI